jgi:hypothetical protein
LATAELIAAFFTGKAQAISPLPYLPGRFAPDSIPSNPEEKL